MLIINALQPKKAYSIGNTVGLHGYRHPPRLRHFGVALSKMFGCVGAPCTGFEVKLVGVGLVFIAEGNGGFNVPRGKL